MANLDPAPDNAPKAGDPASVWTTPPFIKAVLGYSSFAYSVGLVAALLNSARLGFVSAQIPEFEVFLAGTLPTAIVIIGVMLSRKIQTLLSPDRPLSANQVAMDMLLMFLDLGRGYVFMATFVGFAYYLTWSQRIFAATIPAKFWEGKEVIVIVEKTVLHFSERFGLWLSSHMWEIALFGLVALTVYMLAIHVLSELNDLYRLSYFARYSIFLLVLISVGSYVVVGFPRLPQRYGFGAPERVRLLVTPEYDTVLPFASGDAVEKIRLTTPVDLLLKTEKSTLSGVTGDRQLGNRS